MQMKPLIRDTFVNFMQATKATRLFRRYSGVGTILMLHSVNPKTRAPRLQANAGLEVTPIQLEEIIKYFIDRGHKPASLDDLVDNLDHADSNHKKVVFTFDDGYKDNLTHAYPVFKKHNVPFTIYLTGSFIDHTLYPWWYALENALLANNSLRFPFKGQTLEFKCVTLRQKEQAFNIIFDLLACEPIKQSKDILFPYKQEPDFLLTWEDVQLLSRDPLVTIGAHTMSHPILGQLSADQARREMRESKELIESHIKMPVRHLCYPFGFRPKVGSREFALAQECGFKSAVTTRKANIFSGHKDYLLALPRIPVSGLHQGEWKNYLDAFLDGMLPCLHHKFKKVVTD